ncbi:MAG: arabinose efflux permease family protein [Nitrososphaeraceae archaeon]|jgi:MFS family permease|nr:arabinose efflux permease family protein [Nitrososphaeraceae archaeon]MDF2769645.1 arabinose efflux permease family protein [Nitrososphaeraceae archaeon]
MDLLFSWLSRDGKLLLAAKIVRTFAYGFLSVILAIYLKLIGFDDVLIGLVLTVTLVNSVIFTLIASFYADRIGRRRTLVIYAALMSISGAIFVTTENHVMLIIAAFIGTINVTGSETGAFLTIEQSILPQTVKNIKKRNIIFAIYNMVGTFAMSAGVLLSGLPTIIQQQFGETLHQIDSIRPLFILYSLLGIVVIGIYLLLSNRIEVEGKIARPLTQTLSPMSKNIVGKLSGLFAIDSFAGGFVIQSIVSFWFFTKFGADLTTLSYIFSVAGILTAFSFIVSAKIADRFGLINTMVFTHIPSNILIILVAVAPSLSVAIAFYLIRMALSQMDVPTRQSYIVAVVNEEERTAAAGITNISRNISQAISPSLTGIIINTFTLSTPFIIGGLLKIAYDIALYVNFRKIKPPEEELKEDKEKSNG